MAEQHMRPCRTFNEMLALGPGEACENCGSGRRGCDAKQPDGTFKWPCMCCLCFGLQCKPTRQSIKEMWADFVDSTKDHKTFPKPKSIDDFQFTEDALKKYPARQLPFVRAYCSPPEVPPEILEDGRKIMSEEEWTAFLQKKKSKKAATSVKRARISKDAKDTKNKVQMAAGVKRPAEAAPTMSPRATMPLETALRQPWPIAPEFAESESFAYNYSMDQPAIDGQGNSVPAGWTMVTQTWSRTTFVKNGTAELRKFNPALPAVDEARPDTATPGPAPQTQSRELAQRPSKRPKLDEVSTENAENEGEDELDRRLRTLQQSHGDAMDTEDPYEIDIDSVPPVTKAQIEEYASGPSIFEQSLDEPAKTAASKMSIRLKRNADTDETIGMPYPDAAGDALQTSNESAPTDEDIGMPFPDAAQDLQEIEPESDDDFKLYQRTQAPEEE